MRTLRVSTQTAISGDKITSPVIDLFSGNITTARKDYRAMLSKIKAVSIDESFDVNNARVILVDNWIYASTESLASLTSASASGADVFLKWDPTPLFFSPPITDPEDPGYNPVTIDFAINTASINSLDGIFFPGQVDSTNIDLVLAAGLKVGTDTTSTYHGCQRDLVTHIVPDLNFFDEDLYGNVPDVAVSLYKIAYGTCVDFYLNSSSRHWPGESDLTATESIFIPAGTIVKTNDGSTSFMVIETAVIHSDESRTSAYVMPLNRFTTIDAFSLSAHTADVPNLYVSNPQEVRFCNTAIDASSSLMSYTLSLITECTSFFVADDSLKDPGIYFGKEVIDSAVSTLYGTTAWYLLTDIGDIKVSPSLAHVEVQNNLISISGHYFGGDSALGVRTANTVDMLEALAFSPYYNEFKLERYAQFSSSIEAEISGIVILSDDGDTIIYSETDRMVDQLPLWMKWREQGSTGHTMLNIAGRYINDLFDKRWANKYHLDELDTSINGHAVVFPVSYDLVPMIGDIKTVSGVNVPLASDEDELIYSIYPAFYISQGMLYVVGLNIDDIVLGVEIEADDPYIQNLWTDFDEWGLFFNLTRLTGESIIRFKQRIEDVFATGFGGTKDALKSTIIRELSPHGDEEDYITDSSEIEYVDVIDLTDPSLMTTDGFASEELIEIANQQSSIGTHTWGSAVVGSSIFDADGPDREAQARIPYAYDTPISDLGSDALLSGVGPSSDLRLSISNSSTISATVTINVDGYKIEQDFSGRRLAAIAEMIATGTQKTITKNAVDYSFTAKITTTDSSYRIPIKGRSISNVNPNATSLDDHYYNTNFSIHEILTLDSPGVFKTNGACITIDGDEVSDILIDQSDITEILIEETDADVKWFVRYADDTGFYQSLLNSSSDYLPSGAFTALSPIEIGVVVAPFDASEAVADAYERKLTKIVDIYDFLDSGIGTGASKVLTTHGITTPSYVSPSVEYMMRAIAPEDNKNISSSDDVFAIKETELSDLANSVLATLNVDGTYTIDHDPGRQTLSTSWPYVREKRVAVSASSEIVVEDLGLNEVRIIELIPSQIPTLPSGAVVTSTYISSSDPITATLSGTRLEVVRIDNPTYEIMANRGYYWLSGDEDYLYSDLTEYEVTVTDAIDYIDVPERIADFTLVKVYVNDTPWSYRFYQGEDGSKIFSPDGMDAYENSFYVSGQRITFSSSISSATVRIEYEPYKAPGLINTNINVAVNSSWSNRCFIALAPDVTQEPKYLSMTTSSSFAASNRSPLGCTDLVIISVKVLDDNMNPIPSRDISWSSTVENSIVWSESITSDDGRATCYVSPSSITETVVSASLDPEDPLALESTMTITPLSVVSSSSADSFSVKHQSIVKAGDPLLIDIESYVTGTAACAIEFVAGSMDEQVDGTWTAVIDAPSVLNFTGGKASFEYIAENAGLYRLILDNKSISTWRVY